MLYSGVQRCVQPAYDGGGDCTAVYSRDCTGWSSQSVSQCTPVSDQSHTVQCPVRPEKYRQDIITILYHSELFSDNLQHRFR